MKTKVVYIFHSLILVGFLSCKKAFNPNLTTRATNYLAVDGAIISGDSTFITLSRTTTLSDTTQKKVELKAVLSIEDDQSKLYGFAEKGKGIYTLGVTNFSSSRQYRLDIKTSDGKIYQSDFVPMKVTPPIDSIYFKENSDKTLLFYVNAHDGTNSTRYYRWDYKETWSYVPLYQAFYQYKNGQIVPIQPNTPDYINICYRTGLSNQIFVGSSSKLAQDVISNQLLGGLIGGESEKIGHAYVMQLKQYALTQAGFEYYQNLKSNTEQLGSIFDAQPSIIKGNIHCVTSPSDVVMGFISVSTTTTRQFNLHANDIPVRVTDNTGTIEWKQYEYYSSYYYAPPDVDHCKFNTITTTPYSTFAARFTKIFARGDSVLISRDAYIQNDAPAANFLEPDRAIATGYIYYYAPKNCVDCRLKGGTNIKPSYFPAQAY